MGTCMDIIYSTPTTTTTTTQTTTMATTTMYTTDNETEKDDKDNSEEEKDKGHDDYKAMIIVVVAEEVKNLREIHELDSYIRTYLLLLSSGSLTSCCVRTIFCEARTSCSSQHSNARSPSRTLLFFLMP